jgi:hypothetical protein
VLFGVPHSAAMAMVGHKTESIYRRYAIVDAGMLRDAAARIDRAAGTLLGTTTDQASERSGSEVSALGCDLFGFVVTGAGIEPAARALKVRCSTTELPGLDETEKRQTKTQTVRSQISTFCV